MIDVYFVRHGETRGNLAKRHQAENTPLDDDGRQQAAALQSWVQKLQPNKVIASPYVRTLETARIMLTGTNLIPETDPTFIELERPRSIYGRYRKDPRALWYLAAWYLGWAGGDGTGPKGESYAVFRARLRRARAELEALHDNTCIVIVSHSVFISFFCEHLCYGTPMPPWRAVIVFLKLLRLKNGSVTHLQFDPKAGEECGWRLE